jgi:hypothetical protein
MFLLDWYKQWLEIRTEFRAKTNEVIHEEKVCQSCETLRQQLEISNYEKGELLKKLLKEPEAPPITEAPNITPPRMVPWNVRRQMLEREDREKARLMRDAPKPDANTNKADVAELEKELDVASANREAEAANSGRT